MDLPAPRRRWEDKPVLELAGYFEAIVGLYYFVGLRSSDYIISNPQRQSPLDTDGACDNMSTL
jgi:hypothetical protein